MLAGDQPAPPCAAPQQCGRLAPVQSPIDLHVTRRAAFMRGFWKGLAAPMMLFTSYTLPAEAQPAEFTPLARRPAPASDWVRVGEALRAALARERGARGG